MEHLKQETVSGAQLNMDALYQICPQCFTESKDPKTGEVKHTVDFDKLRLLLGDNVAEGDERYDFTWVGKRAALQEAAKPIRKTLRPCPEESVDWENTKNLYIEGDNLEVLKLLQNSYMGKVKMIYIDPPYNTGNDFVYQDDFHQTKKEYDLFAGEVTEEGGRLVRNTGSNGRFHSDWCSMMYSRLMVARNLLTEDGIIFISINDCEIDNLKKITSEVFGEENQLACFCWRTDGNFDNQARIKSCHEYILLFAKNEELVELPNAIDPNIPQNSKIFKTEIRNTIIKNGIKNPIEAVKIPKGFPADISKCCINKDQVVWPKYSKSIIIDDYKTQEDVIAITGWASRAQLQEFIDKGFNDVLDTKGQSTTFVMTKTGAIESIKKRGNTSHVISVLNNMGGTQKATSDMGELGDYFDYPKPVSLMSYLCKFYLEDTDIAMDFFSGSSTTAHAVLVNNAKYNKHCKFIMVQWPEDTPLDSEAYKAGYKNICEIGKERIRRAGKKILEEQKAKQGDLFSGDQNPLDVGFRVFKCADSNMKDVYYSPADYNQQMLFDLEENIKEDRDDLDLLFGCMLDWGVTLDLPLRTEKVDGVNIHVVNEGDLVACFEKHIPESVIDHIASLLPMRVVLRDSCFDEAKEKMNFFEIFKQRTGWSEEEVRKNVKVI